MEKKPLVCVSVVGNLKQQQQKDAKNQGDVECSFFFFLPSTEIVGLQKVFVRHSASVEKFSLVMTHAFTSGISKTFKRTDSNSPERDWTLKPPLTVGKTTDISISTRDMPLSLICRKFLLQKRP